MIKKYKVTLFAEVELNSEDFDEGVLDNEDACEEIALDLFYEDIEYHNQDLTMKYNIEKIS